MLLLSQQYEQIEYYILNIVALANIRCNIRYIESPLIKSVDKDECVLFTTTIITGFLSQKAISEKSGELYHGIAFQIAFNITELFRILRKWSL